MELTHDQINSYWKHLSWALDEVGRYRKYSGLVNGYYENNPRTRVTVANSGGIDNVERKQNNLRKSARSLANSWREEAVSLGLSCSMTSSELFDALLNSDRRDCYRDYLKRRWTPEHVMTMKNVMTPDELEAVFEKRVEKRSKKRAKKIARHHH